MCTKTANTLSEDIEQTIKNKVIQQIKPINFDDEYSIQDDEDLLHDMRDFMEGFIGVPAPKKSCILPDDATVHQPLMALKRGENFMCKVCSKIFTCKRYMKKHFSKHTGRYSCPICKKVRNDLLTFFLFRKYLFIVMCCPYRLLREKKPK